MQNKHTSPGHVSACAGGSADSNTHTHTPSVSKDKQECCVMCSTVQYNTVILTNSCRGKKKKHDDISHAGETSRQRQPFDPVTSPDFAALQNSPAPGTTAHRLSGPEPVS